jgi:hypothetical protein
VPLTEFGEKLLLDWVLGGAAASQPLSRWISFATASPRTDSSFEGPFSPARASIVMAAANSPQMSKTNQSSTLPNITATAVATAVGWNIYNSSAGGNRLAFGTFAASVGCKSADTINISAGGLVIILS